MSYIIPPSRANGSVGLGLALATVTMVAAAANIRYRIVAVNITLQFNSPAALIGEVNLFDSVVAVPPSVTLGAGDFGRYLLFPEPGYVIPVGLALQIQGVANMAGGAAQWDLWYFADAVT